MEFIETRQFMKAANTLLSEDKLRRLQIILSCYPQMGPVIPGTGGLRKIRWDLGGRGKRGGLRIIYYWVTESEQIYLLYMYKKSKQDDLTPDQIRNLRKLMEED